jgi:formate dehydrogenase subunit gamma
MVWSKFRHIVRASALALLVVYATAAGLTGSPLLETGYAAAQTGGAVPGNWSGSTGDTELWRAIRKGVKGTSSVRDPMASTLVQSDGDNWRAFKNGPLAQFGGWLLAFIIVVLVVFRLLRGQIKVDSGLSGQTVERFNAFERAVHWLTASSFIVLGLSGLNVMYGKYVLLPILGQGAFASLTYYGKLAHNYLGFAFMLGIALMFVLWVRHNIFDGTDLKWIAQGGGMLSKGAHPPAKRFNFGQKCIFWIVIFGGVTVSVSGLALMFPYEITPWSETFAILNIFGLGLPIDLTALQETQLSVLWHSAVAFVMIAVIIAHIYIGTPLGMEGAIDAVASGQVDVNWVKEHHSLWGDEVLSQGASSGEGEQPAE